MALSCPSRLLLAAGRRRAPADTRFASTIASLKTETKVDTSENEVVAQDFTNRNPRNLEQLALARKERGWKTTWPKREFWHRLRLERTQHYVEAFVERSNGDVVVIGTAYVQAVYPTLCVRTPLTSSTLFRVAKPGQCNSSTCILVLYLLPGACRLWER
ncbi:mitochondrial ribosomal protein L18 [Willisornis vidua]|uniref:Mitochondrial ribosomal protein L18 n=1 Tax=Willisornis vidua TaxID=1566151 RepID=A0ABQ9D5I6_9PASS|nr:mitochondrial ribosomal protein L18 [Willisornis vidua]